MTDLESSAFQREVIATRLPVDSSLPGTKFKTDGVHRRTRMGFTCPSFQDSFELLARISLVKLIPGDSFDVRVVVSREGGLFPSRLFGKNAGFPRLAGANIGASYAYAISLRRR